MEFHDPKESERSAPAVEAAVLFSGGIDSMACAHMLRARGCSVRGIFVDYGQAAVEQERGAAEALARALSLPPVLCCTARTLYPAGSGEIPGRNAFLIFCAMTLAGINRGILAVGIHAGTSYYDCSPPFFQSISALVAHYTDGRLRVLAPLLDWEKPDIVAYAKEQGLPLDLTYSCEAGTNPPCGQCLSCRDRRSVGC